MKGLYYKDLICSRMPQLFLSMAAGLFLPVAAILFFVPESKEMMAFLYCCTYMVTVYFVVLGTSIENIAGVDSGVRIEAYMLSLPVGKKKSMAAKYLVVFSLYAFLMLFFMLLYLIGGYAWNYEPGILSAGKEIIAWLPAVTSICLIVAAIEMPFYFRFGVRAGNHVRMVLLILLFYGWLVYMMFGNLEIFEHFNLEKLFALLTEHPRFLEGLKWQVVLIMLVIYGLSGILSCKLYSNKELGE